MRPRHHEHSSVIRCGPFDDAEAAADALLFAMLTEGGWWGTGMISRWCLSQGVPDKARSHLVRQLVEDDWLEVADSGCQWRARKVAA